jgi:predicted dehydrogenase
MVRIALVGCGEHSEGGHAIPLARYQRQHPERMVLAAACDIQIGRVRHFCDKYGFRNAYSNLDEMLSREKIDGCVSVVPMGKIAEIAMNLMERRIPCSIEKPLGSSSEEVNHLLASAKSTGTPNMVSVNRRFMPFLNRALEWIKNKRSIEYVRCTMSRQARNEPEFIWATAVHAVDTLRYIAGEIRSHKARNLKFGEHANGFSLDFVFENSAIGRVDVLPTTGMLEEKYELFGNGFYVAVTCPFGARRGWVAYADGVMVREEWTSDELPEDVINGCYDETSCFIDLLSDGRPLRPSIADVAPSVELCMSIAGV